MRSTSVFARTTCLCLIQTWPPVVQCQICRMTFGDKSAISSHYDTAHAHSSTRAPPSPRPEHPGARHKCEVCGRRFRQKSSLSLHLRTVHSTDGPRHECEVCDRKFTQKSHLNHHMRTAHSVDMSAKFAAGSLRETTAWVGIWELLHRVGEISSVTFASRSLSGVHDVGYSEVF